MDDTTVIKPIFWNSAELSDIGTVRSANEDAVFSNVPARFWAVADGMGGHSKGDVASRMIVEALARLQIPDALDDASELVEQCLLDINRQMLEYSEVMFDRAVMGSTVVSLLVRGREAVCLWAGDSRLYCFRNGKLRQLSRDHSYVQDLVDCGAIQPHEAANHPNSNVITRAVGVDSDLKIETAGFEIEVDDDFLLCSDGLYNAVPLEDICLCMALREPAEAARSLVDTAIKYGASDNVSVVVVKSAPGSFL